MTPSHAIYSATLLTLVGLSAGIAVDRAASQELSPRNELMADPRSTPTSPAASVRNPVQDSSSAPSAMSPPGNVWPPQAIGRPNPLWAIPIASLSATRERPIFSPSRRSPLKAAPPAPQQSLRGNEPNRPLLALVGTVVATPEGIAIFHEEKSKDIVRLRTGESHSGWTLTAVKAREVTLSHGHETAVLVIPSPPAQSSPPRK